MNNNPMLKPSIDNHKGLISNLLLNEDDLVYPFSIEFGDPNSFFSLEQPGWRASRRNLAINSTSNSIKGNMDVEVSTGEAQLNWQDSVTKNIVSRQAKLTAITDLLLMDFVIQYRFRADIFPKAKINGQVYAHNDHNIYIQHPVTEVELFGNLSHNGEPIMAKITTNSSSHNGNFRPEMYIRDRGNMWIVHARLMPSIPSKELIKLNVPWYNKALPSSISKLLLAVPGLKNYLWYRGELKGYPVWNPIVRFFKPSAYIFSKLSQNEALSLDTSLEVTY